MDRDRYLTADTPLDLSNPKPWVLSRHIDNLVLRIRSAPTKSARQRRDKLHLSPDRRLYASFAELQRMRLRELQCRLVNHIVSMRADPRTPVDWEADLKEYIQTVRDYDYMTSCSTRPADPFVVSAERLTDDEVLQRASFVHHAFDAPADYAALDPVSTLYKWESAREPIGGTRSATHWHGWYTGFLQRLWFGLVGGVFLLAPMWIMVLHRTRDTCLATTTAFVVAFAGVLAWRMEKPADVLAATLAYAAVLVVFVGLAVDDGGSGGADKGIQ
ncbi:hypothetical protein QBC39DRAFT_89498 [Podospora conica]|nr:hypothetical protein QBC39DRAFT_89498 [Schizothecium conicum]